MKRFYPLLLGMLILFPASIAFAQSDKGFSYQAVARDQNGSLLSNSPVNLRFQLREGSSVGTIAYQETHSLTTNQFGLFHTVIGKGNIEIGDFQTIPWSEDDYFLVVEMNGVGMDTTLLQGVPYALVATNMSIHALTDVSDTPPGSGQVLKWDGTEWAPGSDAIGLTYVAGNGISLTGATITNTAPDLPVSLTGGGATSVSGTYPNFTVTSTDNVDDADADATNELQNLSLTGNDLSISNGNMVTLPAAPVYTAGTGISVSGTTISNTSPDQTVTLSGAGATSVSGSYPNFTVSSTDNVNDADANPSNEIQSLSLSGNTLALSQGGGNISLASFVSPWSNSGSNLYFNTGKVGIGDNSPVATLTVGNGDKLQISGSDGDIKFNDDQGSIRFANANGSNASMMYMFASGTNNSTRMLVSHSPNFSSWGLQYNDTADAFNWIGDNLPVMQIQLSGQRRIGIGTDSPSGKVHVVENSSTGIGHLKLTETQLDFSRITMDNTVHGNFWDIAARTDTNLSNAELNIYHSDTGDLLTINARGRVGINDQAPNYALEVDGNGDRRIINAYNTLPTTATTTYNYGVRVNLSQSGNTGFPRLYNLYGISTDTDAYITYGLYGYASGASFRNYGVYAYAPTTNGYAVYANGDVYSTGSYLPSDSRLKTGVTSITNSLELIGQLHPKTYQYNQREYDFLNLPQQTQYGFVAQEVAALLPELTKETFHAYDEALSDTEEGQGVLFTSVNYIGFIPILVAGMQEQQAIIEDQQQEIEDLKARMERLERLVGE